jgi:hypothetical protein
MKNINFKAIVPMSLIILFLFSSVYSQPTEKNLLNAWEDVIKSDSKTIVFEKTDKNMYKFNTERFPFDGKLKVLSVNIDSVNEIQDGYIPGIIEIELIGLSDDITAKYSYSYSTWLQNNYLYYNTSTEEWLSSKAYYKEIQEKYKIQPYKYWNILTNIPFVIFFLFIIFMIILLIKTQRKNKKYIDTAQEATNRSLEIAEKSIKIAEEDNKILKEILEILRNRG